MRFTSKLSKFIESNLECTNFSVHGITIQSEFTVIVKVRLDGMGESTHEKIFPVIVRAPKQGDFINDLDSLGVTRIIPS